ncbi:hypothetical protein PG275_04480 [Riemerella anatipestifer]|nr:hypothetical protein [Riemerella anatipestifer]
MKIIEEIKKAVTKSFDYFASFTYFNICFLMIISALSTLRNETM